ncbi:Uncharacterised protein [Listeria welshimeri]|nr:Uncharacterised protein [Listeria welshimeri]
MMLQKQTYLNKLSCNPNLESSFNTAINNHAISFGIFKQIKH